MQTLMESDVDAVGGGLTGWGFVGAVLGIGAATIAVASAVTVGPAVAGVLAIGAIGANALESYANGR